MKSLIAATFLLVLVQLASANTIYVQNYAEAGCRGGKVGQLHAVPTDTCLAIPPSNSSNFTSFSFGAVTTQEFAKVYYGDGANCTHTGALHVPCGQCLPTNKPGKGNFRYNCHKAGQFAFAEYDCNSDCSACGTPTKLVAGKCLVFGTHRKQYVELDAIATSSTVSENVWAQSTTCAGAPAITYPIECGNCYGSSKFSCSITKGKSFLPRHAQKGGEFHHLKHLEKSL